MRASICRCLAAVSALSLVLLPASLSAHPMGNFSISHYAGIRIEGHLVEVRYLIDMAEIPTFQELQHAGIEPRLDDRRLAAYLSSKAQTFAQGLQLTLNGHPLTLRLLTQDVIFPPGAGNLPTMKFGFSYSAELPRDCSSTTCQMEYQDTNFADRAGWKEIVVTAGEGLSVANSTASNRDRSAQLSNYPTDLLDSPPQDLQARVVFSVLPPQAAVATVSSNIASAQSSTASSRHRQPYVRRPLSIAHANTSSLSPNTESRPGDATAPNIELKPNQQATPHNRFTELMTIKHVGIGMMLLAAPAAAGLGALHALEPGHGKTIVAAYLVGSKGTAHHALLLGLVVTASHTAGVYLLGAVTLYAQKYILPDRIYPFLGVLSGLLIVGVGCYLFLQRLLGTEFTHTHNHEIPAASVPTAGAPHPENFPARELLILGVSGGIVPCPAALVVLLSAAALRRTLFGLYLIVAFSIGLAAVLIAMGLAAVYARRSMSRFRLEGPMVQRWLPMASATMITILGTTLAIRGLVAAGILRILTRS